MTIDVKALAEKYKLTEAEVSKKINDKTNAIKLKIGDLYSADKIDAEVEKLVVGSLGDMFSLSGLEYAKDQAAKGGLKTFDVIILGAGKPEDGNDYKKRQITMKYYRALNGGKWAEKNEDGTWGEPVDHAPDLEVANAMLTNKIVRLAKSKEGKDYAIALDSERTIKIKGDDGQVVEEKENPNFGKDIPEAWSFKVPMIVSKVYDKFDQTPGAENVGKAVNEFKMGTMRCEDRHGNGVKNLPAIGRKSRVYGRLAGKGLSISKDAYEDFGVFDQSYDVALTIMSKQGSGEKDLDMIWRDLCEFEDLDAYKTFSAKGTLQYKKLTGSEKERNQVIQIKVGDADVTTGISMKSRYAPVIADVADEMGVHDEVIVFGRKMSFAPDKEKPTIKMPYYELWGVIASKDVTGAEAKKRLKEAGLI